MMLSALAIGLSGCQSLKPFNQTMQTRVAAARQWTGNGLDAIRRGSMSEAKSCFSKAATQLPDDYRIVANLARAHAQEGQLSAAIEQMQRAVKMSHGDPELQIELGEFHLAAGQIELAQQQADLGRSGNRRLASACLLQGRIFAANQDSQAALGAYQRGMGIDASRDDIQLEIVKTYQQMNQPLRALSAVEQLLEKHPADRQPEVAVLAKSSALMQLQQVSPAIEILETASRRQDASDDLFIELANAQLRAGRDVQAQETLVRAQQAFPQHDRIAALAETVNAKSRRVATLGEVYR